MARKAIIDGMEEVGFRFVGVSEMGDITFETSDDGFTVYPTYFEDWDEVRNFLANC